MVGMISSCTATHLAIAYVSIRCVNAAAKESFGQLGCLFVHKRTDGGPTQPNSTQPLIRTWECRASSGKLGSEDAELAETEFSVAAVASLDSDPVLGFRTIVS